MGKTFLNSYLYRRATEPLEWFSKWSTQTSEYIYEDRKVVVLSVTWDRDMAAQQSREALASSARNGPFRV